ncbi:hypothetical protein RJ639_033270 [Escallonia herrerae]|uniref:Uncharacterized protein n=1 Tax=Escallonia herrerae TaxID=1293975 RepID=A0AA88X0Z1_9ASTE|nr:hypothetical protein RJ639_033270 [Escallonia herrerae]
MSVNHRLAIQSIIVYNNTHSEEETDKRSGYIRILICRGLKGATEMQQTRSHSASSTSATAASASRTTSWDSIQSTRTTNSNGEPRREFDSLSLRLIRPATVLTVLDDSLPRYNGNTSEIGALQIADPANQSNGTELFQTQEIRRQIK